MAKDRVSQVVDMQIRAAEMQKACKWMPPENFFPNMIGHMALIYGPARAAEVLTVFEMAVQDHEELLDDMCREPRRVSKAFQEGVSNWLQKRGE